ncbi:MAG: LysM domain-containing protein [Deltaproteobacteria bacterium]|nr:LysM domain-containing protein [Deltaproteobacteria bacterium]
MGIGDRRAVLGIILALALVLSSTDTAAFPHIVKPGQSVAQIAEQVYGRVEVERVVVAANGLDARRGSGIVPGMRLELPAVGYYKVLPDDTWKSIAVERLGHERRADVLSQVNDSRPWLPPEVGREIVVPYNLRYVARIGDTTQSVAYRFLGVRKGAWKIASYNGLRRAKFKQGEVILVPLTDLALTDVGKRAALNAGALVRGQGGGAARRVQERANLEIPKLSQDIRRGRYVDAVVRGASLLAQEGLSDNQLAEIYRLLTVGYVALDATGRAVTACAKWRQLDPTQVLNPIDHSPKILAVCVGDTDEEADLGGADGGAAR